MATIDDVRRIAMSLPRTTEHLIGDHTKFRVARLAALDAGELRELLTDAWCMVVPKTVAARYLAGQLS